MNAETIIELLGLKPHPEEGGFYSETYRSGEYITQSALPGRYIGERTFGTCIYYLITNAISTEIAQRAGFSALHKLESDEIFHFYLGDPLEMLNLYPDGSGKVINIGSRLDKGEVPQVIVEKGVWQGTRLKDGGKFALLGTTVAPGFEFRDYTHGNRDELIEQYPLWKEFIMELTRE